MSEVARFPLGDGDGFVLVEVDRTPGMNPAAAGDRFVQAQQTFEAAFAQVRSAGSSALAAIAEMPWRPDEIELKFGIKLDAQAGAIIARTGMQAQFEVKLRWQNGTTPRRDEPEEPEPRTSPASDGPPA